MAIQALIDSDSVRILNKENVSLQQRIVEKTSEIDRLTGLVEEQHASINQLQAASTQLNEQLNTQSNQLKKQSEEIASLAKMIEELKKSQVLNEHIAILQNHVCSICLSLCPCHISRAFSEQKLFVDDRWRPSEGKCVTRREIIDTTSIGRWSFSRCGRWEKRFRIRSNRWERLYWQWSSISFDTITYRNIRQIFDHSRWEQRRSSILLLLRLLLLRSTLAEETLELFVIIVLVSNLHYCDLLSGHGSLSPDSAASFHVDHRCQSSGDVCRGDRWWCWRTVSNVRCRRLGDGR